MLSLRRVLPVTLLLLPVALGPLFASQSTRIAVARDRWGVALHADRPFYLGGEEAHVVFRLPNQSPFDAFGFVPSLGGNGCTFRLTIEDAAGQTVWQPGSIVGGSFQPPGCLFGTKFWSLLRGTSSDEARDIPLVYQNAGGIGVQGAPLAPGVYRVALEVFFNGPSPVPVDPEFPTGGLNQQARLPIRVQ